MDKPGPTDALVRSEVGRAALLLIRCGDLLGLGFPDVGVGDGDRTFALRAVAARR